MCFMLAIDIDLDLAMNNNFHQCWTKGHAKGDTINDFGRKSHLYWNKKKLRYYARAGWGLLSLLYVPKNDMIVGRKWWIVRPELREGVCGCGNEIVTL